MVFKRNLPIGSIFISKVFNDVRIDIVEIIVVKNTVRSIERFDKRFKKHLVEFLSVVFTWYI